MHTLAVTMRRSIWTGSIVVSLAAGGFVVTTWWIQRPRAEPVRPSRSLVAGAAWPEALAAPVEAALRQVRTSAGSPAALRQLARLYQANHLYPEARDAYDRLEDGGTTLTASDHYLQARLALQMGDSERVQSHLERALELAPHYQPARVLLGLVKLKSGRAESAAADFAAVVAQEPTHIEATVNLARLDLQKGDRAAARERLEALVARRPEATSAIALLAQLAERSGETEQAAVWRERSQQRPEPPAPDPWLAELDEHLYDPTLLGLRFEELAQTGDLERAQRLLRRIEEVEPDSPIRSVLQGSAAARAGRHEDAVQHFQTALARGADPEKVGPVLVSSLLTLGRIEEALAVVLAQRERLPSSIPLLVAHSDVFVKDKSRPEAKEVLVQVLAQQPYLVPQNMALAEILWTDGDFEAAAPRLQRVVEVDTKHLAARALLAEYHLRRSDPASALVMLEQAQRLDAAEPAVREQLAGLTASAHLLAGRQALAQGDTQKAVAHIDQAARAAPGEPEVQGACAGLLVELKEFVGAIKALERLAKLQPDNPTVWLSLGDLLRQQGQYAEAMQHWRAAWRLVPPEDERLRAALTERLSGEKGVRAAR